MIISASYKTDIPAFYGPWFMERLRAGFCSLANPFSGVVSPISLLPADVDGFVFWTKNLGPFIDSLPAIYHQGFPFTVQYTINGYPRELERAVTAPRHAIEHMRRLAGGYGPRCGVWRYDTVLLTSLTSADWHMMNFETLACSLEGLTDEVVLSFAHFYRKTRRNLDLAARAQQFTWIDPDLETRQRLLDRFAACARAHGIRATLCAQPELMAEPARCIDAARLADVAGRPIRGRTKGNRPGCECAESRDIGAYETCPHGCVYCYAVHTHARARRNFLRHDPSAPLLGEPRAAC
jgi:hypothetical protein